MLTAFALSVLGLTATAQTETHLVDKINGYAQTTLTKVEIPFSQISGQQTLTGTIYLNRPQRQLKVVYDPPDKRVIVASHNTIYNYDPKVQSFASYPLSSTAAAILLQDSLSTEPKEGIFYILDISQSESEITATLTLELNSFAKLRFTKNPFALKGWEVEDALGRTIYVQLGKIQPTQFPKNFFTLKDPRFTPF